MTHVLTVSGSLRHGSSNIALLDAVARVAPADVTVSAYTALADIPAFNPDLEADTAPVHPAVAHWRDALASADAVLVSSPEYAHGIPGVLKNALDWVVGSGELVNKPVGVLTASAASEFVHPQLVEVLRVMNALIVPDATYVIDIPRRGADAEELAKNPTIAPSLAAAITALAGARAR